MTRTWLLQELRRMRFKEAYGGWQERRPTSSKGAQVVAATALGCLTLGSVYRRTICQGETLPPLQSELSELRAASEAHRTTRLVEGNRTQNRPLANGRSPCRRDRCRRRAEPPTLHRRLRHPCGMPEDPAALSLRAPSLPSADPKPGWGSEARVQR